MKKVFFAKVFICISGCGLMLYSYINTQNALCARRLLLPALAKEVSVLHEENTRLRFEIERFEDPKHLMELANQQTYRHLKYVDYASICSDRLIATNP